MTTREEAREAHHRMSVLARFSEIDHETVGRLAAALWGYIAELEREKDSLRQWFKDAVEAATPLQCGGKYAHLLRLGDRIVQDGIKALIGRVAELEAENASHLQDIETAHRWYKDAAERMFELEAQADKRYEQGYSDGEGSREADYTFLRMEHLPDDYQDMEPAEAVKALAAEVKTLRGKVPRWMPVGEKLPEHRDGPFGNSPLVLICLSNDFRSSGFYDYREKRWEYRHREEVPHLHVTHWMPLPPAPRTP